MLMLGGMESPRENRPAGVNEDCSDTERPSRDETSFNREKIFRAFCRILITYLVCGSDP
jgi:hypothetical protein